MPEYVEFQLKDLTVISILWTYRMFSYWLYSLSLYTFNVLFPDKELRSAYFYYVDVWVFFLVCAGIIFGALLVDSFGNRFAMSITGLCLCCSTPFIGALTCMTKAAPSAILMFFTASGMSIVSPATYSLIFNQNTDPRRRHARLVVSFFECMESLLGKYLVYICLPGRPIGTYHELHFAIALWVVFIPLLVTLVILSERVKKHVTGDFVNEKGIQNVLHGLFSDFRIQPPKRKGKSLIQVVFFMLLLLPSLCLTSLGAALDNAHSDDEAKAQSPVLKHISLSTRVMIIPFTELVLTLIPKLKETFREILVVGFAHVINIAVLSLFVFRLDNMPVTPANSIGERKEFNDKRDAPERLRSDAEVCIDPELCSVPRPSPGAISFHVMTSASVTLQTVPQTFFKEVPYALDALRLVYGVYRMPGAKSELMLQFSYQFNSAASSKSVKLIEKKHYVFVLTSGHSTNIECSVVTGMEGVKPKANPQLILFNSLCNKMIDGVPNNNKYHEYRIASTESGFYERHTFPEACTYKVTELPVGKVKVSYLYKGSNPAIFRILNEDSATFTTEPSIVYLAFVLHDTSQLFLYIRRLYKPDPVTTPPVTETTATTEKPPQPREPDSVQQSTYAMSGAALGIAAVGYTHFFWVESPVRLRAVMYALFRVSNELVRWTTEKVVGDSFTRQAAIGILSIQVVTTVWHVGLSWIYQTIIIRLAKESTMEPPS